MELEALEPQFVRFLAAQGIPAPDWVKIKVTDEPRAEQLIDQFSQMVYADVLQRCEYLEQRSKNQLLVYKCGPTLLELRGLILVGNHDIDFRQNLSAEVMGEFLKNESSSMKVVSAQRLYRTDRASELFKLLESGARIGNSSELFDSLATVTPEPREEASGDASNPISD